MTKLLVPTDFSSGSKNAAKYAVEIAKIIDAHIILFYIEMFPSKVSDGEVNSRLLKTNAKLKKLAEELEVSLPGRIRTERVTTTDHQSHEILKLAENEKVDIIIMGTKGRDAVADQQIGSNTTAVIRNCFTPVIAVPANYKFQPIDKIIVGFENADFLTKSLVANLKLLSESFRANMVLMKIYQLSTFQEEGGGALTVNDKLQKLFDTDKTAFEFRFSKSVVEGLNQAAVKEKADLIVMMPHKTNWLGRIFHRSKTRRMALLLNKPLLILPPDLNNAKWRKTMSTT